MGHFTGYPCFQEQPGGDHAGTAVTEAATGAATDAATGSVTVTVTVTVTNAGSVSVTDLPSGQPRAVGKAEVPGSNSESLPPRDQLRVHLGYHRTPGGASSWTE